MEQLVGEIKKDGLDEARPIHKQRNVFFFLAAREF